MVSFAELIEDIIRLICDYAKLSDATGRLFV